MIKIGRLILQFLILCVTAQVTQGQWIQTSTDSSGLAWCFAVEGSEIFAGTAGKGVLRSIDEGDHWITVSTGLKTKTDSLVFALITGARAQPGLPISLVAGTGDGIFFSTNSGGLWIPSVGFSANTQIMTLVISAGPPGVEPLNLFAGCREGVFESTDNGMNWLQVGMKDTAVWALSSSPGAVGTTTLFAGMAGGGVFRSTNNGILWTEVNNGLANPYIQTLVSRVDTPLTDAHYLFAGTYAGGVFRSTDDGSSWDSAGLPGTILWSFAVAGNRLFAGTHMGVFLTTDNGSHWDSVNTGLVYRNIRGLCASKNYLLAGTVGGGIWRRPLSEMIPTSVEKYLISEPGGFRLGQNYPNPFNPTTTIGYTVGGVRHHQPPPDINGGGGRAGASGLAGASGISDVRLVVYDILGREVAVLVNEKKAPGNYEVKFDATNLASGIYFYRLITNTYLEMRKMILVR